MTGRKTGQRTPVTTTTTASQVTNVDATVRSGQSEEYDRFEQLARGLVQVPKSEIDAKREQAAKD